MGWLNPERWIPTVPVVGLEPRANVELYLDMAMPLVCMYFTTYFTTGGYMSYGCIWWGEQLGDPHVSSSSYDMYPPPHLI